MVVKLCDAMRLGSFDNDGIDSNVIIVLSNEIIITEKKHFFQLTSDDVCI